MIKNYSDFVEALLTAGFSMGGGNDEGVFGLITHNWNEETTPDNPIRWHTGDPDTDPWEWRMRVLDERDDIAYAKMFFKKSGYITREWYPYFLATRRRNGVTFEQDYQDGNISQFAKRIYQAVSENGALPLDEIKRQTGFSRDDKSKFDSALVELQMKLYLTMCGKAQKISADGTAYGWEATVFCTTESFWNDDVFAQAAEISREDAIDKITAQVLRLNPNAEDKKVAKLFRV